MGEGRLDAGAESLTQGSQGDRLRVAGMIGEDIPTEVRLRTLGQTKSAWGCRGMKEGLST